MGIASSEDGGVLMQVRSKFVARYRKSDNKPQYLDDHLFNVAQRSKENAAKIGLAKTGELIGLSHDIGKNVNVWKDYLKYRVGLIEAPSSKTPKGNMDHSTAGAQVLYEALRETKGSANVEADILSMVVASHHGIIDAIRPDGIDALGKRLGKDDKDTRKEEALENLSSDLKQKLNDLLDSDIRGEIERFFYKVLLKEYKDAEAKFVSGLLVRYLLSCLIDADWTDAANHDEDMPTKSTEPIDWTPFVTRLEEHLSKLQTKAGAEPQKKAINSLRSEVSQSCLEASQKEQGFFRLNVPTGGGKTLASLRFALHHAVKHHLDRIIYVIPYTSILDQNADSIREALDLDEDDMHILLEHHSNLTFEKKLSEEEEKKRDSEYQMLAENWNSPIILTTMVQFLETFYAPGTKRCRRMHQLANSIIIFDEIQTLPLKMFHLFNLATKFLVDGCRSSIMLCTATQQLLHKLDNPARSLPLDLDKQISVSEEHKIRALNRIQVFDSTRPHGWNSQEIADLALNECNFEKSVLVIVNTKKQASMIYNLLKDTQEIPIFHLSTNMCSEHRRTELKKITTLLKTEKPLVLISTQLIEAGVDVDFHVVIRSLTGVDSIAQAAGRCNRHGSRTDGRVIIINPTDERLNRLPEMLEAKKITETLLGKFKNGEIETQPTHFLSEVVIESYFERYNNEFRNQMNYPVDQRSAIGRMDDLVRVLGANGVSVAAYRTKNNSNPNRFLRQSFRSAAESFQVIPNIGHGIIVPYGAGKDIITELSGVFQPGKHFKVLRQAQRYSVNCFQHELEKLASEQGLSEVQPGSGIFYLRDGYYHERLGLTLERSQKMDTISY